MFCCWRRAFVIFSARFEPLKFVIMGIVKIVRIMILILSTAQVIPAQLTPDEIPPNLKYILKTDVETWEAPDEIRENLPYYLSGFDYENRPIWVVEYGKWDLRYFVEKGKKWENLVDKYMDQVLFRFYNSTWLKGTEDLPVKDGVLIVDFHGLSARQISSPPALNFFITKMRRIVSALPLAHEIFVVNVNFIAKQLVEMLRPILGKDFYRVEMFGTNPQTYKIALLKVLPPDQIPDWYGGAKGFKPLAIYG